MQQKEEIRDMYWKHGMSQREIAQKLNTSQSSIRRFMNKHNIKKRDGRHKKTDEQFKKEVYDLVGEEYTFLEKYDGVHKKIKCRHNKCGNIYKVTPGRFLSKGDRCPQCMHQKQVRSQTKNQSTFDKEVSQTTNGEYVFLEKYVNNHTPLKCRHKKCGFIWRVTPNRFLDKEQRCPRCSGSVPEPELIIYDYLSNEGLNFEREYGFGKCKNKQKLRFDFAAFKNEEVVCLIEYDGKHHYEVIDHYGEDLCKLTQENDLIKNKFCKKYGIPLIRIPYWKRDNLKNVLKKELKKLKII